MLPPQLRGRGRSPLYPGYGSQPFLPSLIDHLDLGNGSAYSVRRRTVAWTDGLQRLIGPPHACSNPECPSRTDGNLKFRLFIGYADIIFGSWRAECQRCHRLTKARQHDIHPELQQQIDDIIREELKEAACVGIPASAHGPSHKQGEDAEALDLEQAIRAIDEMERKERRRQERADKAAQAAELRRQKDKKLADDIARRVAETHQVPKARKKPRREMKIVGERTITLVAWWESGKPPQTMQLTFANAERCNVAEDAEVSRLLREAGSTISNAQVWCAFASEWETCLCSLSLTSGAPMLLLRAHEMRCPNFALEVRRLEELAPETDVGRKRAHAEAKKAWSRAIARDHYEGFVYVVLWYKDLEIPLTLQLPLAEDRTFALHDDDALMQAMSDNRERYVLVWDHRCTDWKTYRLDERVQVPKDDHTVLMRVAILLGLPPYLGVEMQAQLLRPDTINTYDPRHPAQAKGKARAEPFGARNAIKEEVDIDLVEEEKRARQARWAAALEDGVLDVDKYCM